MTGGRVDAVIATVGQHDPELAGWMRVVADGLTAGEGEELISQASLQVFLWYTPPRKYPEDAWRRVAAEVCRTGRCWRERRAGARGSGPAA